MRGSTGVLLCLLLVATGTVSLAQGFSPGGAPSVRFAYLKESPDSPGHGYPLITFPYPYYPLEFSRAGVEGFVEARLEVGPDGRVKNVSILKSSHAEFESPVIWAARRWRFVESPYPGAKQRSGLTILCRVEFYFEEG